MLAELPLILATAIFVGANFYLWSLHPTELQLLAISVPLGTAFFVGFFRAITHKR